MDDRVNLSCCLSESIQGNSGLGDRGQAVDMHAHGQAAAHVVHVRRQLHVADHGRARPSLVALSATCTRQLASTPGNQVASCPRRHPPRTRLGTLQFLRKNSKSLRRNRGSPASLPSPLASVCCLASRVVLFLPPLVTSLFKVRMASCMPYRVL